MRTRPSFWTDTHNPGRTNLVNGLGFALWAYGPGQGTDSKIAEQLGIGVPARYVGTSNLVPSWMVASNANGQVVAFQGTTELAQWASYITEFGASPCSLVGGLTFAPFEAWSNEIAGRLRTQVDANARLAFVGHSLGGAMAIVCAAKLAAMGFPRPVVYTSGCPFVGDQDFTAAYQPTAHNLIKVGDIVPALPPSALANPLFCAFGRPILPRMFRPGLEWVMPGFRGNQVNVAAWVLASDPTAWIRRLPTSIAEIHTSGQYLTQAWSLCDHEDKSAAAAWGVIASQFFGLDVQPV